MGNGCRQQPGRGFRDVGQATWAAVRDGEQPARQAAKLGGDDRRVPGRNHFAVVASACCTDCHSFAYQGAGPDGWAWLLASGWLPSTM